MKGQFEFNEDVGGLFINIIACYLIVFFTLGIGTLGMFVEFKDGGQNYHNIDGRNKFMEKEVLILVSLY